MSVNVCSNIMIVTYKIIAYIKTFMIFSMFVHSTIHSNWMIFLLTNLSLWVSIYSGKCFFIPNLKGKWQLHLLPNTYAFVSQLFCSRYKVAFIEHPIILSKAREKNVESWFLNCSSIWAGHLELRSLCRHGVFSLWDQPSITRRCT